MNCSGNRSHRSYSLSVRCVHYYMVRVDIALPPQTFVNAGWLDQHVIDVIDIDCARGDRDRALLLNS